MAKINIGIDLNPEEIKAVCLKAGDGTYSLESYGIYTYGGDINKLKDFVSSSGIQRGEIRINIEDPSLKIRRLDLPEMTLAEVPEAIKWGMREIIEGEPEDFFFKHISIDASDLTVPGKMPFLVFAVKKSAVWGVYDIAKKTGLARPKVIEPNVAALCRLFELCMGKEREKAEAVIDLGKTFSPFIVIGKKGIVFSRPLAGCGEQNFVAQLSRDIGVTFDSAKEKKLAYFRGEKARDDILLKNSIAQFYSRMAVEVQRSIDGYNVVFGKDRKIDKIFLTGSGVYYKGLTNYLAETLNIDVLVFDPFLNIDVREFSPGPFDQRRAAFSTACGLAVD